MTGHLKAVDGLEGRLTAAKGRRNHLAHDFCFEAAPLLLAPEPALQVIAELDADETTFLDLADEVAAISRAILEEAGIDRALTDAVGAALIEQAKAQ
ncbi:hypothetical protein [Streptomyces sp. NPDC051183]|uniref:hypothetical protein n=1 Tax=Streptomyces sp. NPDC051183 TaxID=3155165 RepID=UPI003445F071